MSAGTLQADKPPGLIRSTPARIEWSAATVSVPLNMAIGQPVVNAYINEQGPFKLLLDTGSPVTKLDDDVVKGLGLSTGRRVVRRAEGETPQEEADAAAVSALALGGAKFVDFDVIVRDYDAVFEKERLYDGAVGLPMFVDVLLTLDYPAGLATVSRGELPPADGASILDYQPTDGIARLRLMFSGLAVDTVIDSGRACALVLAESLRRQVRVTTKPAERGPLAGDLGIEMAPLRGSVRLGRYQLHEPPVYFLGTDSAFGHRVLANFAVSFDQKHHRVRFDRAGDEVIRFAPDAGFGIIVGMRRGRLIIQRVLPDSPAERNGLLAGDAIRDVNGHSAFEYDEGSLTRILATTTVVDLGVERNGLPLIVRLEKDVDETEDE